MNCECFTSRNFTPKKRGVGETEHNTRIKTSNVQQRRTSEKDVLCTTCSPFEEGEKNTLQTYERMVGVRCVCGPGRASHLMAGERDRDGHLPHTHVHSRKQTEGVAGFFCRPKCTTYVPQSELRRLCVSATCNYTEWWMVRVHCTRPLAEREKERKNYQMYC